LGRSFAVLLLLMALLGACADTNGTAAEVDHSAAPQTNAEPSAAGAAASPSMEAEAGMSAAASPSAVAEAAASAAASTDAQGEEPAGEGLITLADITADPESLFGQTVQVSGTLNVVNSERVFSIADNPLFDLHEVLIIAEPDAALPSAEVEDAIVTVSGTVRPLVVAEIERDFGLDLDAELEAEWERRPVIVAERVDVGDANVTLDDITENPQVYAGQTVSVAGGIDEVKTERAFTIVDSTFLDLNEVLVIGAREEAIDAAVVTGSPVRVLGEVQLFDLAQLEQDLGRDLDDAAFEDWPGKPVIVADTVQVTEIVDATLDSITDDPAAYYGRLITVEGGIDELHGERSFTIADSTLTDANELLVIGASPEVLDTALAAEQPVRVRGVLHELAVAEIERDFDLDLQPEIEAEYEQKPVLIATNVEVVE